jgi:hypothetical protein
MSPTVFDSYGTDRLTKWKEFRDSLETSATPLEDVAELWSHAPFVSPYLDPQNPNEWPDPWHLILDLHLDELAIVLGMLYTIKLTHRFIDTECEIHTIMLSNKKEPSYFVVVDKKHVLNLEYRTVVDADKIIDLKTNMIWSKSRM